MLSTHTSTSPYFFAGPVRRAFLRGAPAYSIFALRGDAFAHLERVGVDALSNVYGMPRLGARATLTAHQQFPPIPLSCGSA